MQHCQQAPVSNEFSTAVLADSIAVRGESYLFSITVTAGSVMVTLCHSIIWSGGPFSLFDLVSLVYYLTEKQNVLYLCKCIPLLFF